jgi:WD40 repeat protein
VVVSPDGKTAYSTSEVDGTVLIWDLSGDRRLGRRFDVGAGPEGNASFALSAQADVLAVSRQGGAVDLWDLRSLSRLWKVPAVHGGTTWGVALSPDGRQLVTTGYDGTVARWDVAKQSMIGRPSPGTRGVGWTAAFSPDGRLFATAGDNVRPEKPGMTSSFIVWDAKTGQRLQTFTLRGGPWGPPPLGLAFSPDERFLAGQTALFPTSVGQSAVWDIASRQKMLFVKHSIAVMAAFAPDGRSMAFANGDRSVTFRDLQTGNQAAAPLQGLPGDTIDESPDGTKLAVSGTSGVVQLWDLTSRRLIGSDLLGPANVRVTAAFTSDGIHLLVVYADGTAILWNLDPAAWEAQACAVAGRNLSQTEWSELLPTQPYQQLCP